MLTSDALARLRARIRVRFNWFLAALLGPEVLSREELHEVIAVKPLPDREISLTERSFLLGRMKLLMKRSEWNSADMKDLMRASKAMTPLERLAMKDARQNAAHHIRGIESDIAAGVFSGIRSANAKVVSQATVTEAIQDEVSLAVLYKKNYDQLAVAMTQRLGVALTPRWKKISRTELHRAKVAGSVQAIVNRVGPFSNLNGIDSQVSIITNPNTCPDCAKHYTDSDGNPKVFTLRALIAAGTNADGSVSHKKRAGVHVHWKPTLPPMHPECACSPVPIPPGMSWKAGRLTATDVQKAFGDSALSATNKPKGPDSAQAAPKAPPSIPGIKSPGQKTPTPTAAPGDTPGGADGETSEPCPLGEAECVKNGGTGSHRQGSKLLQAHRELLGKGAKSSDPEAASQDAAQAKIAATAWDKKADEHPHHVALDHLKNGTIAAKDRLGEAQSGVQDTYKVAIAGNGSALYKPAQEYSPEVMSGKHCVPGSSTAPHGQGHKAEKAAYNMHMAFGLTDHVPPTETRMDEGKAVSMQSWQEGFKSLGDAVRDGAHPDAKTNHYVDHMIQSCPPSKQEALITKLSEGVVMASVLNHMDQHANNVMFNADTHDVRFIDNTNTGGNSMAGHRNRIHREFHSLGRKLKVPDHLMDKFSKTSLGDIKRSSAGMADWQQGQTFLRMKYVEHLQETEGELDYGKFRSTQVWSDGTESPLHQKDWSLDDFVATSEAGALPSQLFDGFAKQWIDEHSSNRDSPHYGDANELAGIGVFMPSTLDVMQSPAAFRAERGHLTYGRSIQGGEPTKVLPVGTSKVSRAPGKKATTSEKAKQDNQSTAVGTPNKEEQSGDETAVGQKTPATQQGESGVDPYATTQRAPKKAHKPQEDEESTAVGKKRKLKKSLFIKSALLTKSVKGLK